MASLNVHLLLCVIVLSTTVLIVESKNDVEDKLLQGINNYRVSNKLPVLKEIDNSECLADEVADKLENQPCTYKNGTSTTPSIGTQFTDYPKALQKCKIDLNTTKGGAILLACVPKLESSQVLSNFTQSKNTRYLNDSVFTGIGIGSEDDWIVVVMSTATSTGNLSSAAFSVVAKVGLVHHCLLVLLLFFLGMIVM